MTVKALIKELSKEGFSIMKSGEGYKVMRNHVQGSFSSLNGRPINLYTASVRIASEYNEGYQPGTQHYSTLRFLAALKQV